MHPRSQERMTVSIGMCRREYSWLSRAQASCKATYAMDALFNEVKLAVLAEAISELVVF